MSKLQTNYCLKLDFQKVDRDTGTKWLTHGTKHGKDNQLQSLKPHCRMLSFRIHIWHRGGGGGGGVWWEVQNEY